MEVGEFLDVDVNVDVECGCSHGCGGAREYVYVRVSATWYVDIDGVPHNATGKHAPLDKFSEVVFSLMGKEGANAARCVY